MNDPFAAPLAAIDEAVADILRNLGYVTEQLTSIAADPALAARVRAACGEITQSISWDIRDEVGTLRDKLYPQLGNLPAGVNPDPRVTLELITNWLRADLDQYHQVVQDVSAAGQRLPSTATDLLTVLVEESGANMLNARGRLLAAAEAILRALA